MMLGDSIVHRVAKIVMMLQFGIVGVQLNVEAHLFWITEKEFGKKMQQMHQNSSNCNIRASSSIRRIWYLFKR